MPSDGYMYGTIWENRDNCSPLKLIEKLGIKPTVYHLNEGHSAFLIIKRLNNLMNSKEFSFDEAREIILAIGGQIEVSSEIDVGTRFRLTIPAA